MEYKKSVPSENQIQNQKIDVQFDKNMYGDSNTSTIIQYGRDILLKLRLHPISLEKPVNLPKIEVVKDKLHLHDGVDSTFSTDKNLDQSSLNTDYCNLKHDYPYYSHSFNGLNMYNYLYMKAVLADLKEYNRPYQNASSKFRSAFHTNCNAFKKPYVSKDSCYKKVSNENLWTKQCYLTSDDVWICNPNHVHSKCEKSKEDVDAVSKSRKKLSIIDPVTGKDILDGVTPSPSKSVKETCAEQAKCSGKKIASGEKYAAKYFCRNGMIGDFKEVPSDFSTSYTEDEIFSENQKDVFVNPAKYVDKNLKDISKLERTSGKTSVRFSKTFNCDLDAMCNSGTTSENSHSGLKSYESKKLNSETHKQISRPLPMFYQAQESKNFNIHGNCLAHVKNRDTSQINEDVLKENDFAKDNVKQLKEKINTLTQDQNMAILQSYLLYKKFKLEEMARNLDEKRIKIANLECNLLHKDKGLLEREQWLNSKEENLQCKEQQLSEWEKSLNKKRGSEVSYDFHHCKNVEKEHFLEKRFGLDSCIKSPWDEVPVSNVLRGEESEEFTRFLSTTEGISNNVSSIKRSVSDTSSLDELEKNIIFMEKMSSPINADNSSSDDKSKHASFNELEKNIIFMEKMSSPINADNSSSDDKSKHASFNELEKNIIFMEKMSSPINADNSSSEEKSKHPSLNDNKKEDDISSCDPLGYSKGCRYLPEHMKYWVNIRDKNAM